MITATSVAVIKCSEWLKVKILCLTVPFLNNCFDVFSNNQL